MGFKEHKDSVFCINYLPKEPFNTFVSGDCNDKAFVWKIYKEELKVEEPPKELQEEEKQH